MSSFNIDKKKENQKYVYKKFTYKIEDENHVVIHKKAEPDSFFKYYSVNKNNIEALVKNYLYTTHPYSFNDSIDSSELLIDFSNITLERYKSVYKQLIKKEELEKYNLDKWFQEDRQIGFKNIKDFVYKYFTRQIGLVSLTTQPLNILMWSHYATESGFVIELDKEKLLGNLKTLNEDAQMHSLRPIQYVKQLESIDMFLDNFKDLRIPFFLYMTNIKRMEWKYEDEWRLAIYKKDMGLPWSYINPNLSDYKGVNHRKLYYLKDTIKSIVLGKNFFNGGNTNKINVDGSIILKTTPFLDFVNHINENYNNCLYMSGEIEKEKNFGRSVGRIELEKLEWNTFKIIKKQEVFYKL